MSALENKIREVIYKHLTASDLYFNPKTKERVQG
jgi:hypothetical protein